VLLIRRASEEKFPGGMRGATEKRPKIALLRLFQGRTTEKRPKNI